MPGSHRWDSAVSLLSDRVPLCQELAMGWVFASPVSEATLVGWKLLLKGVPFSCGWYTHRGTECKYSDFSLHCEIYSLTSVCRLVFGSNITLLTIR